MREFSLCQEWIGQVTELARKHQAKSVVCVRVQVGLLAGVEPPLLESAFTIARAGTVAQQGEMYTESVQPCVLCLASGRESARPAPLATRSGLAWSRTKGLAGFGGRQGLGRKAHFRSMDEQV